MDAHDLPIKKALPVKIRAISGKFLFDPRAFAFIRGKEVFSLKILVSALISGQTFLGNHLQFHYASELRHIQLI